MTLKFNDDFKFGVATAATQIEGGNLNSNWNHWHDLGKIKHHDDPAVADDHYNRVSEDIELLKTLNVTVYRMGIEWARIEPEPGVFNQNVLKHYRDELIQLREAGITPLLTLYHFSHPMWFEQMGGFLHPEAISIFLRYVKRVLIYVEDLVDEYITINEPNVYAMNSYFFKEWPPGDGNLLHTIQVMNTLAEAHILTYQTIHRLVRRDCVKVSFAHHVRVFSPKDAHNPLHVSLTRMNQWIFQDCLSKACYRGEFCFPLVQPKSVQRGEYADFIAINYYTRSTISGLKDGVKEGAPHNDLGWEIYPQGIVEVAQDLYKVLARDIWITENGTCDNQDTFRNRYLFEHFKAMTESSLPFKRYYHWTFIDNFEWVEGYSAKFGLIGVDLDTQIRTRKASADFFAEVAMTHEVSESLYERTVADQQYPLD